jgi:hypothetical protein
MQKCDGSRRGRLSPTARTATAAIPIQRGRADRQLHIRHRRRLHRDQGGRNADGRRLRGENIVVLVL